jgi:Domain of unknown function (DUF2017)
MGLFRRERVSSSGGGRWNLRLSDAERQVLTRNLPVLRELISDPTDPRVRRLFPPTYLDDEEQQAEYYRLMHEELVTSKLAALDAFERTCDSTTLTDDELFGWMQSINSLRLVLGTMLDVGEDDRGFIDEDDPNLAAYEFYNYLSGLLDEIVTAQSVA